MESAMNQDNIRQCKKLAQVKVSVGPGLAAAFKVVCASSSISMAAELARFMSGYAFGTVKHKATPDYSTRQRRRAAIKAIFKELELMKGSEERVRDNTPDNLQGSDAYQATEEAIDSLDAAIDALTAFWMVP